MATLPATKIIRSIFGKGGRVFNDKTTFGRSYKIWGANSDTVDRIVIALLDAGINAEKVLTRETVTGWPGSKPHRNIRIWVTE
jgi:hypothetical protein